MSHKYFLLLLLNVIYMHASIAQQVFRSYDAAGNKKATVSEWVGITTVEVSYNRPAVKGREGKIWGQVVHYGFANLGYGTSESAPWRAGADENTTISFSTDVMIEGKPLNAGKYGFFIAMGPEKATVIFSKFTTAWGSFYYDPKDDALRVDVPVVKLKESVERLKYEFSDQTENSAILSMQWEYVKVPFKISVDLQKEQIAEYRRAVYAGEFYSRWQNMQKAANYCLVNNIDLEEGLQWARRSVEDFFFGDSNFLTLSTYAGLLEKLGRKKQADSVMAIAYPKATPIQRANYAMSLLAQKKNQQAYDLLKINYDHDPEDINVMYGMVKGLFAIGNKTEAIKLAEKLKDKLEDSNSKALVSKLIQDIKDGKDINGK